MCRLRPPLTSDASTRKLTTRQYLSVLSLHYVSHFEIAKYVPLDKEISYPDLAAKSGRELTALRRLTRHAMTSKIFHEPVKDHIAHTPASRLLVEDRKTAAWVDLCTESIFLAGAHTCDALERWPGSQNPRHTGLSLGVGNPGQTSLYEEAKKDPKRMAKFKDAIELFSSGEGYEASFLVEGYDWDKLGEGTLVDVSLLHLIRSNPHPSAMH